MPGAALKFGAGADVFPTNAVWGPADGAPPVESMSLPHPGWVLPYTSWFHPPLLRFGRRQMCIGWCLGDRHCNRGTQGRWCCSNWWNHHCFPHHIISLDPQKISLISCQRKVNQKSAKVFIAKADRKKSAEGGESPLEAPPLCRFLSVRLCDENFGAFCGGRDIGPKGVL